ncbi:MAG: FitA-like ribbon-helix-helix domain-containing protein [Pyrinomonadaceae bacterium]
MPNVLVRDVEIDVLDRLKLRASRQHRSLQAELNIILRDASNKREPLSDLEMARKIKASIVNKNQTDSAILLREDRDR